MQTGIFGLPTFRQGARQSGHSPTLVAKQQGTSSDDSGKTITVAEGETIENFDFTLSRGGVVTGA
jgi:hypothetical protein